MNDSAFQPSAPTPSPLPGLDPRHGAMLAEMGVNVWWRPETPASAPNALHTESAPVTARARLAPVAPPAVVPVAAPSVPLAVPTAPAALLTRPQRAVPLPATPVTATIQRPQAAVVPLLPAVAGDHVALDAAIRTCNACDLGARRRHAVPGMGDPAPDWLVVGEAPGEEEDRQGLPFVGRAGQLLDRMLAAMDLSRERKVYIANVIKCRPPHNRNPDPVEIAQCEPYLLRQVELLRPRIILAMGRFAAHTLLAHSPAFNPETLRQLPLGKLRGRVHTVHLDGRTLPLIVTYHPAYLLRSPAEKAKSWADLCLALETFEHLPDRA